MSREIKYIGMDVHKEAVVIATSVLLASSSTTVAEFIATELSTTSGHAKSVARARSEPQCTSADFRGLIIHQNEPARQRARELVNTPEFAKAQRQRKKVEALFAELKNQIGLRRLRLRRLRFVREQFFLAAVAQNIKRLVRFLSQATTPVLPATT